MFQIQDVFVFGVCFGFGYQIVEFKVGIVLQDFLVVFGFQFVDDVVGGCGDDQRCFEFDFVIGFFDVFQYLCDDFDVVFVDYVGFDKVQIDFFCCVVIGYRVNGVVGVMFGYVGIVYVGIGDYWFVDQVQIDFDFGEVFCIGIGGQCGFFI